MRLIKQMSEQRLAEQLHIFYSALSYFALPCFIVHSHFLHYHVLLCTLIFCTTLIYSLLPFFAVGLPVSRLQQARIMLLQYGTADHRQKYCYSSNYPYPPHEAQQTEA